MQDFAGRVAVITGGASGIGRAIAERFAAEGVHLVLADIEAPVLASTVAELAATGARVIGVPTDVAVLADVQRLADRTLDEFGAVHIVCNNAGVAGGSITTAPPEVWDWVLGVNLFGVIHGCSTFLPILLEQDVGHIVNTASIAGLGGVGAFGVYCTSKFAVVGLSESLHHELAALGSAVKVSVLCPGFLNTNIYSSERNMPGASTRRGRSTPRSPPRASTRSRRSCPAPRSQPTRCSLRCATSASSCSPTSVRRPRPPRPASRGCGAVNLRASTRPTPSCRSRARLVRCGWW